MFGIHNTLKNGCVSKFIILCMHKISKLNGTLAINIALLPVLPNNSSTLVLPQYYSHDVISQALPFSLCIQSMPRRSRVSLLCLWKTYSHKQSPVLTDASVWTLQPHPLIKRGIANKTWHPSTVKPPTIIMGSLKCRQYINLYTTLALIDFTVELIHL